MWWILRAMMPLKPAKANYHSLRVGACSSCVQLSGTLLRALSYHADASCHRGKCNRRITRPATIITFFVHQFQRSRFIMPVNVDIAVGGGGAMATEGVGIIVASAEGAEYPFLQIAQRNRNAIVVQ